MQGRVPARKRIRARRSVIFGLGAVEKEGEGLTATATDEGRVFVVGFVRDSLRARLRRNELHFAYQAASPGLIDADTKFALHGLKLALPSFAISHQFEAMAIAPDRPRVGGKRLSHDGGPGACEPRERCIRLLEPAHDASEKFSCALHEAGDSSTTRLWKCARLHPRFDRAKIAK